MTGTVIILAVVIGVLCGGLLVAVAIFFWYLLKTVRALNDTVGQFTRAIDPLIKTGALQVLASSAAQAIGIGNQMLAAMKNINTTVGLFNKAFFNKSAVAGTAVTTEEEEFGSREESATYGYSEGDAAIREKQEALRRSGIETDETRVPQPAAEQMKGVEL